MNSSNTIEMIQAHLNAGRFVQAEAACREILVKEPDNNAALYFLARITDRDERYEESSRYLESVLQSDPSNPDLLCEYGRSLRLAKRSGDALPFLRKALSSRKTYPVYLELGLALADTEAFDKARSALNQALKLNPACRISLNRLGYMAMVDGDLDEAIHYYEKVAGLLPDDINSYPDLIKMHLMARDPRSALDLCEKCLQIEPACTGVFAFKYIALSELEDTSGAKYLLDPEHHVRPIAAVCPLSFDSIQDFNSYFADHILNHTKKTSTPEKYTTRDGWQTQNGTLFDQNKQLGELVAKMISEAVDEYVSHLPDDPEHPLNKGRPSVQHIESWGVVLGRGGHQAPHIHPKGWLSCSYYIQLPEDFDSQPEPDAGHIVFGQGEYRLHPLHKPVTRTVKPLEGYFVIFPSYAWHHTIPLLSNGQRICMAFDVVATKGWGK